MQARLNEIRDRLENYSCEDSEFIINSKDDIQFLLDELEQAQESLNLTQEISGRYEKCAESLQTKLNKSQDRERVLMEALTKVNNLAWDVLSTLENERGVVEGQLEYDYLKDIETVVDKALKQEDTK